MMIVATSNESRGSKAAGRCSEARAAWKSISSKSISQQPPWLPDITKPSGFCGLEFGKHGVLHPRKPVRLIDHRNHEGLLGMFGGPEFYI